MSPRFNLDDYETVETRLAKFWAEHAHGRVTTDLVHHGDGTFIVKAYLFREGEDVAFGTGLAEEIVGQGNVNKTSALENCETSAIGRALANAGYAPMGSRPSREEMDKVNRAIEAGPPGEEGPKPQRFQRVTPAGGETRIASEKQRYMLKKRKEKAGVTEEAWTEASLPPLDDVFPFDKVNEALAFLDALVDS